MKKTFTSALITGTLASSLILGGVDATKYEGEVMADKALTVATENIVVSQKDNVVEATMPWKGERGLTLKYDLKEPTLLEKLTDKRDEEVITEKIIHGTSTEAFKIDILLKAKPDTNRFCLTVGGYEYYDFFHQPALTEQEIADGYVRPDDVVGSYAVYHKTLSHHKTGGTNYGTGKMTHIYYPYIWEVGKEDQKIRAEDFTYNEGQLCVIAPQDFLDNADYTNGVRIDPTLGVTDRGASTAAQPGQDFYAATVTATEDGEVTSTWVWAQDGAPDSVKGVLVLQSSEAIVTNGVGTGAAVQTTSPAPVATESAFGTSPTISNGVTYYAGEVNSAAIGALYYDAAVDGDGFIDGSNVYATPTDPTDGATSANRYSIYLEYTATGGSPAAVEDDEVILIE